MGKSNYELYAEKRQNELLKEKRSLNHCIAWLKGNKEIYSEEYIEAQIDFVAALFGLNSGEVKKAVEGQEYWCI